MRRCSNPLRLAVTFTIALAWTGVAHATSISIINLNTSGQGLNDTTPASPVGGNNGTTRGQQRLIALQYAADRWAEQINSNVPILVGAQFASMTCSSNSAQLGQAGAGSLHANFVGAPRQETFYPAALANRLAGFDLNTNANDITATFNSTIGTSCSFPSTWYYGLDANPPQGSIDFVTIAMHELAHGLGFATYVDVNTGAKVGGRDDIFMTHLEDHSSGALFSSMTDAQRVAATVDTGDLHFVGASVGADSTFLSAGRHPSGHVLMYAPNPVVGGSSLSHFDVSLTADDVMEPSYLGPNHNVTLARAALRDLGWAGCGDGVLAPGEQCDDGNAQNGDCCSSTCHFEANGSSCASDGNACTNDVCNGSGACNHVNNTASCDDGVFCNGADTCSAGSCTGHAGNPCAGGNQCNNVCNEAADNCAVTAGTACSDDGNPCTNDQCNGSGSCAHPANAAPCNDGLFCNGSDVCSNGSCSVHTGNPCSGGAQCNNLCNESADNCLAPSGSACGDDGNVCTNDQCNGSGSCVHPNNTAPCSDGLFCNGADTCNGGACTVHAGNPCSGGAECNNVCNESADNCAVANGTPCTSDTNICTNDVCNGAGACGHPANTAPCDDGNTCTSNDACSAGTCQGQSLHCGDGVVQTSCGEECDAGGNALTGCNNSCRLDTTAIKCKRSIGLQTRVLATKNLTQAQRCFDRVASDRLGCVNNMCALNPNAATPTFLPGSTCETSIDCCPDYDSSLALATSGAKMNTYALKAEHSLRMSCSLGSGADGVKGTDDDAYVNPQVIGFPGQCADMDGACNAIDVSHLSVSGAGNDLVDCIQCVSETIANDVLGLDYPLGAASSDEVSCQRALGVQARKLAADQVTLRQKCMDRVAAHGLACQANVCVLNPLSSAPISVAGSQCAGDADCCPLYDSVDPLKSTQSKLDAVAAKIAAAIRRSCSIDRGLDGVSGSPDDVYVTPEALGFAGQCPTVLGECGSIDAADMCSVGADNDLLECLRCIGDSAAAGLTNFGM